MRMDIDTVLKALSKQAESDAQDYQRRRPGLRPSSDTLYIDACEMADYRYPGKDDEVEALRSCYVLVFRTAVRY